MISVSTVFKRLIIYYVFQILSTPRNNMYWNEPSQGTSKSQMIELEFIMLGFERGEKPEKNGLESRERASIIYSYETPEGSEDHERRVHYRYVPPLDP